MRDGGIRNCLPLNGLNGGAGIAQENRHKVVVSGLSRDGGEWSELTRFKLDLARARARPGHVELQ